MLHRLSEVNTVNAIPGTVEGSVRSQIDAASANATNATNATATSRSPHH